MKNKILKHLKTPRKSSNIKNANSIIYKFSKFTISYKSTKLKNFKTSLRTLSVGSLLKFNN